MYIFIRHYKIIDNAFQCNAFLGDKTNWRTKKKSNHMTFLTFIDRCGTTAVMWGH